MIKQQSPNFKVLPLSIVGSNNFGRYPKISDESTYNMIISDEWLVPFAGHKKVEIFPGENGRGIFNSVRYNHLIVVVENNVYIVDHNLHSNKVGSIDTFTGDVFIDENDASQIAICDKKDIYIFDYVDNTFEKAKMPDGSPLDFIPGYITFQDGYFISPQSGEPKWRLSTLNDGTKWPAGANNVGLFQTKPDNVMACVKLPGRGNQLFVMGKTVTELWIDAGYALFPYQRTTAFNIDYGCLNPATIATGDTFVVWLGSNEKSGPIILYSTGGDFQQISNDGINFKLAQLTNPQDAYGFLFKQDGHLFYQLTFHDPADNFTILFDFNTQRFFYLCDELMNYHPAKKVAMFNNKYYFISFSDGSLYELNSEYTTYDGKEIPRIRVCPTFRLPDSSTFVVNNLNFILEQGENEDISRVDMSASYDGAVNFSNYMHLTLNPLGKRRNRCVAWGSGYTNEFTPQFRFWGTDRFVVQNGTMSIYQ